MEEFGKLNFSVSFNRTSAFPIEANGYFTSLAEAEAAAQTAVEVGSADSTYYIGETLTVVEGDTAKNYIIQPDKTLKEIQYSDELTWNNIEGKPQATSDLLGLVKIGYVENGKNYPVELSNGQMYVNVPWTDTNTTYTLSSFGITATATELNYCDGVTSNIQTQLNNKANANDLNSKQDSLTSGVNIKTINEQSVLGNGNISIEEVGKIDSISNGTGEIFNDYTNNTAKGNYSHVEGYSYSKISSSLTTKDDIYNDWYYQLINNRSNSYSIAFGEASHVEGINNISLGDYSHAEGDFNVAYGESAHAEGYRTKAFGICSHVEGGKMTGAPEPRAYGYGDHVEGNSCITVDSNTCHAEGSGNLVSGAYSHAEGVGLNYSADQPEIISIDSPTKSFVLNGDFTSIDVSNQLFGVEKVIIPNAIIVINDKKYTVNNVELTSGNTKVTVDEDLNITLEDVVYFAIYNKGYCVGNASHIEGGGNRIIGNNSHAEGGNNFIKGDLSHVEGLQNTINGARNHVEGQANTVNGGQVNHVEGNQCVSNGNVCHLEGQRTIAYNNMEHAQGNYNKSNTGDTTDKKTRHSIGIGTSEDNRKNAQEVMENGDHYIIGIGGYDGTNPEAAQTLQQTINDKYTKVESDSKYLSLTGGTMSGGIQFRSNGKGGNIGYNNPDFVIQNSQNNKILALLDSGDLTYDNNKVWHEGNDGPGSGLDADLLDGLSWNNFFARKYYLINIQSLSESNFYPIFFDSSDIELDCEIHSNNNPDGDPYNQNRLHFQLTTQGWDDTGLSFHLLSRNNYVNEEITIGAIGRGNRFGGTAIWVRGGKSYRIYANREPQLKSSDYDYQGEIYTVGTNLWGGNNSEINILWINDSTRNNKLIATLDSTVAAATKLQTPCSLWGQSFDGTSDINGDLSITKDIPILSITSSNYLHSWIKFNHGFINNIDCNNGGIISSGQGTPELVGKTDESLTGELSNNTHGIGFINARKNIGGWHFINKDEEVSYIDYTGDIKTKGSIYSLGFNKTNSSDDYVLLGGGGHKLLSELGGSGYNRVTLITSGFNYIFFDTGEFRCKTLNQTSDEKLKTNIQPIDDPKQLQLVQFNWKDSAQKGYGFIADDVEKYYPELIGTDDKGYKSLNYTSAICIKLAELENKIKQLESEIQQLKS